MTNGLWTHDRVRAKDWVGTGDPVVAHAKLDGHRITLFKQKDGSVAVFSRKVEPHLNMFEQLEHLDWFKKACNKMLPFSSIDGELYCVGERASKIKNILINEPTRLRFGPFAIPYWDGKDLAFYHVATTHHKLGQLGFEFIPEFFDINPDDLNARTVKVLLKKAKERYYEGWVLKRTNYEGWWKVKEERTVDAIVIGFKDSESDKNIGLCGALHVGLIDPITSDIFDDTYFDDFEASYDGLSKIDCPMFILEVAAVAGMDDETREAISESDYGRVCEVKYQLVDGRGRLRHPRFIRWRDDKPRLECTKDQLDG